jgi:hypothetical protein
VYRNQSVRGFLLALGACAVLGSAQLPAADPCCSIVSIDKTTGIVTLRDHKTGKLEKVTVKDAARLAQLTVGQPADRSIGKRLRYCSINTYEPCLDQERTHNCQPCPD